uniref:Nuclear pore membrane glycoprotein 210 n=2 Tax=Trichobilharzia regenti TaxID=157069 RepID=A0AA85JNC3_TRIRE|nr:unnamed protein product [Trichobilharzia regenti]
MHVVLFFTFLQIVYCDFKLSDSKLLLPFYSVNPVNFTLHGSDGACYEWHSGTPEVAVVSPIVTPESGCSTAAVITAVWQSRHRAVATIYAKIINAEHIVKCDVIVDDIHRIEISTTTQELYLHNTPVSLVVTAFDEYGNTFSSLEGVPFEWRLFENRYEEFGDAQNVLRFITWSESEYTTPSTMALLESKGLQGYMQLISGLRTGSAVVSVALQESIYMNVAPCQVRLLVMANAQLSPALAYLVPNSILTFTVHVIQQGDDQEVSMPSLQYHLQVNNTDLAVLSPLDGCTLKALNYGQTEVTLLDRNVEEALEKLDQVMKSEVEESDLLLPKRRRPTSLIQIVEPAYLGFTLMQKSTSKQSDMCQLAAFLSSGSYVSHIGSGSHMPIRKWIMESGKVYVITVDIYDRNNHRLYPSDNLRLTLNFPESHFEILQSSSNQTYVIVKASSSGTVSLKAVLKGVIDQDGSFIEFNSVITGSQDVTIYSPIKIHPTSVILPWSMNTSPSFNRTLPDAGYQLRASGGCGQYRWTALSANALEYYANSGRIPAVESLTDTVVSITKTGLISALDLGESVIVASSFSNPQLCGHTIAHVRSPTEMRFVSGRNEVLIPSRRKATFADDSLSYTYSVQSADSELNSRDVSTMKSNLERLAVGLAVLDSEGQSMTDCRHLNIEIHAVDPSVVKILPGFYAPRSNSSVDYGSFDLVECLHFYVIGVNVGFTEIKAVYNPSSSSGKVDESSVIVARFPVAAYRKIAFIDPASETTSVALGSTRSMLITHGPQPWSLQPSEHYIKVYAQPDSDNDISSLPTLIEEPYFYKSSNIKEKDTRLPPIHTYMNDQIDSQARLISFSLRCEGIGMFEFVVEIGNHPTSTNLYPMVLTSKFTIMCDVAVSLQLIPLFQLPLLPSHYPPCPLVNTSSADWSHDKLILPNTIPTAVSLVLFGSENQELESVDSFLFNVVISTAKSATTTKQKQQIVQNFNPPVYHNNFNYDKGSLSHPMHPRPRFFITPADFGHSSGDLSIQVTIQSSSPHKYVPFLSGIQSLQSVLNAYLSPMVHVVPAQSLLLFYHPDATSSAHIHGGSGHYYLEGSGDLNDPHHHPLRITEQFNEPNRMTDRTTSYIIPQRTYKIQPQNVGHAIIEAVDLCFPALSKSSQLTENYFNPAKTEFSVDVIGLSAINLRVIDRIQLGDEVTASIEATGTDGHVLPAKFARLLKLSIVNDRLVYSKSGHKESHDSKKILGVPDTDVSSESFWIFNSSSLEAPCSGQFSVRGLALGTSQLMVTSVIPRLSRNKPITVQSNIVEIQVFAPLRLTPCNFNLLLGAEYELHAVGGPSQASLEFIPESASGRITIVKSNPTSVLIRASESLGLATIRARAVGISGGKYSGKHDDYVIYSETVCSIHVVALSGVRIGCPLANMNEVISQIHDHSSIHVQELSNSGESDRHFLLSCPPGRTNDCGSTPLWAEGLAHSPYYSEDQSNSNLVSPLGMAAVFPPLRFRWHLNPPEPSSVARLEYWLNRFGIDADENHSAAGMILVGLKPGTVTVHLTVEPTDPSAKQINAVSTDSVSTDRLHAQLTIVILSRLGLNSPPREPQQIILSPNSQLNLIPWTDVRSDSILRYKVSILSHYTNISLARTDEIVTVTSDGILRVNDKCSNIGSICQMTLQIESIPNGNLLNLKQSHDFQTSLKQTLILNVYVKLPRYMMFTTPRVFIPQSDKSSKIKGLPVGGPYKLEIKYHDELGRLFDAVSDDFHQLKTSLHRSDLFSAQFIRDFVTEEYFLTDNAYNTATRSAASFGMSIHSSPMSSAIDDIDLIQSTKKNQPEKNPHWTVMHITLSNKIVGLSPSYLSLPHTNSLDLLGLTSLVEGQWICLPKLSTSSSLEDTWSSVDPSILWIDSSEQLILARHSGQGILTYSLTPSIKDSQQDETLKNSTYFNTRLNPLTYLIKLPVVPLEVYSFGMPSSSLILVDTGISIPQSEPITFPIGIDRRSRGESFSSMLRFLVQLPTKESTNIPYPKAPSSVFAASAPFKCLIRLQTNDELHMDSSYRPSLLPHWLSHLVLWEYNETVENILESQSAKFTLERSLSTQLEPLSQSSPFYSASTQWQCVVRSPASWSFSFDAIALTLLPKTRMTLQLVRSDASKSVEQEENSSVIAQTSLLPLPGIKVLVPPALKSQDDSQSSTSRNLYHFWITHTDSFTQRLLIFIPPATAYALSMKELGQDKLLVRSQMPDILEIVGLVHPVENMLEIVDILKNYIQSLSSSAASVTLTSYPSSVTSELSHWLHVINEQIENIEDDAISGQNSSILKYKVLWAIQVRCIPGDVAIDTVVNVVLSLRSTGQHIEIPVRVSLPSVSQLDAKEIIKQSTSSPYFLNFSWIHLFAVIVVTLLIAVIVHIILRSETLVSSSSGSNVGKYSTGPLPPLTNNLNHSHANGQLWSQSFIPSRSPNTFRQSPLSYAGLRSPNYSTSFHSESLPTHTGSTNMLQRTPPKLNVGGSGDLVNDERRWRQALSGNASRLRDSFDNM